jgi:hypothetical protein
MKPLNNIALLSVIYLLSSCGEQLVEFPNSEGSGGKSARGGASGTGGRGGTPGTGGRTSGGSIGAAGLGGEAGADDGAAGSSTATGGRPPVGSGGTAGEAGSVGDTGGAINLGGKGGKSGQSGEGGVGGAGIGLLGGAAGEFGIPLPLDGGSGGQLSLDNDPPEIISTIPEDEDENVAINMVVTATFSEPMRPLTVTESFTLTGPGNTPVEGVAEYSVVGNFGSFDPDEDLEPDTEFTATISNDAVDLSGLPMLTTYVWTFTTGTEAAQVARQLDVPLGAAAPFAVLASAAITNLPTSNIDGDVGLFPDTGSEITGFSMPLTCPEVQGTIYAVDVAGPACAEDEPVLLAEAKLAAQTAFINARAAVRGTPQAISGNLNGLTLYPGLYESDTSLQISAGGFLYLDAQGDPNAVFIIRSATSITTLATSEVVLTKSANAANVFWTAGSAVTLGTNSIMKGTIIAGTAVSLLTGANLEGRALNQGPAAAAITLQSSTILLPTP